MSPSRCSLCRKRSPNLRRRLWFVSDGTEVQHVCPDCLQSEGRRSGIYYLIILAALLIAAGVIAWGVWRF